jgi:putative transposase
MQLVEKHLIKKADPRYALCDAAAFKSKNLYNAALYETRQTFIAHGTYLFYEELDKLMQPHEAYKALPAKVAQQVLRQVTDAWKAFREASKAHKEDPSKFLGRPKLPKYKHKTQGRNLLVYTSQAVSKTALRKGAVVPSRLGIEVISLCPEVDQVRLVPRNGCYVVEVIYEQEIQPEPVRADLYGSIDLGITNLATLTSNKLGFVPLLVNGRPVKSINQNYNKKRADLQGKLAKMDPNRHTSQRLERLTNQRNRKIDHELHTASRRIIGLLVEEGIGTLVIGYNQEWKQQVNIGKRNTQNFVTIPFARFIHMLTYKAELVGIRIIMTEESYTSKCSFLDWEDLGKQEQYAGKRVKRGLFQAANGKRYNADVNGSYNILRKVAPDAFGQRSSGCVVHPRPLAVQR